MSTHASCAQSLHLWHWIQSSSNVSPQMMHSVSCSLSSWVKLWIFFFVFILLVAAFFLIVLVLLVAALVFLVAAFFSTNAFLKGEDVRISLFCVFHERAARRLLDASGRGDNWLSNSFTVEGAVDSVISDVVVGIIDGCILPLADGCDIRLVDGCWLLLVDGCWVQLVDGCWLQLVDGCWLQHVDFCWLQLVDDCDPTTVSSEKAGSCSILVIDDGKKSKSLKISLLNG